MSPDRLNRILVPTDLSETATHALRYASELARSTGASLIVLYADPFLPPPDYAATVGAWDECTFDLLKARTKEQMDADAKANIDPAVPYETVVRVTGTIDGILMQARESGAQLIVMGTHGRTGVRRLVLGSVTEAVMRRSEVPVIAVPADSPMPSMQTIVCPITSGAQCGTALAMAAQIAPANARFLVVHPKPTDGASRSQSDLTEKALLVPEIIASRCDFRTIDPEHVADQVEDLARSFGAGLIVATEHDGRSAGDVLHGTLAARLVQRAACPVLTIKAPAAALPLPIAPEQPHPAVSPTY